MNITEILNVTNINELTPERLVEVSSKLVAVPELIILFVSCLLIFLAAGLLSVNKNSRMKYLLIWLVSSVLLFILMLILIYSPNTVINLTSKIIGGLKGG